MEYLLVVKYPNGHSGTSHKASMWDLVDVEIKFSQHVKRGATSVILSGMDRNGDLFEIKNFNLNVLRNTVDQLDLI